MCTFLNHHASSLSLGTDRYIGDKMCEGVHSSSSHKKDKNLKNTLLEKNYRMIFNGLL
jgi:hypothetical protein